MQKLLPLTLLFVLLSYVAVAQQLPLYTQYIFNPYLVNPSMVGSNDQTEVNLLFRQQWSEIEDSPQTIQFDAQFPINNKMALGAYVTNDQTVLLNQTAALLTYGYRVPLTDEHSIGFGLSAGVFQNRINLSDIASVDLTDPALLNARNNNMAVDGQFGFNYRFRGLTFGYSLVNLFQRKLLSPEKFQETKLSQLKNQIIFASYRFTIQEDMWYLQPNFAYRLSESGPNFYEGSAVVSYRNLIDVGGGYRQEFGPTGMVRVHVGPFQAGFAYDFPSPTAQVSVGGTKEIQIKWLIGKKRAAPVKKTPPAAHEKTAPVTTPPQHKTEPAQPKHEATPPKTEEKTPVRDPVIENKTQPAVITPPVEQPKIEQPKTPEPVVEYYFVVGTFRDRANAQTLMNSLKQRGMKGEIGESRIPGQETYYFVHLPEYKTTDVTLEKIKEMQRKTGFNDAWFRKAN